MYVWVHVYTCKRLSLSTFELSWDSPHLPDTRPIREQYHMGNMTSARDDLVLGVNSLQIGLHSGCKTGLDCGSEGHNEHL